MSKTLEQINKFLDDKDNKKYHFNNFNEEDYKISSGSLNLDLALGGGLPSGAHRFTGVNEGGKTSCALSFARNFQKHFGKNGMVVVIKAEGRLSNEMLKRAGVDIDPEKFFVLDCNIFEKVFEFIRDLVFNNEDGKKYMFIVDSVDALCRMNDVDKPFSESEQVAGGALPVRHDAPLVVGDLELLDGVAVDAVLVLDAAPALTQYRRRQLAPRWHRRVSTVAPLADGQRSATRARNAERAGKTRLLKEIARHREGVAVCWGLLWGCRSPTGPPI